MPLLDLWKKQPEQIKDKQIQQLIAFAGTGKLLDESPCSIEFRAFLASVPSNYLSMYSDQCLSQSFQDSGLALQDIVNEIGVRIGASVTNGRYRGSSKHLGYDGLWTFPNSHSVIIEVKTTDAYRIDLNIIAQYRHALIESKAINEDNSSMLLIVGRQDTGDLEAQIRGSRHAWDIRVISVDALLRLMSIKEELEDPNIIQRIHSILIPREFTRLDEIAEVLFSTAEDIKQDELSIEIKNDQIVEKAQEPKFTPVSFYQECIDCVQKKLGISLIKRSRAGYSTPDKNIAINLSISKEHDPDSHPNYWFAFHPHQLEFLKTHSKSYVAFGCGNGQSVLLIPITDFEPLLETIWTTTNNDRTYWHIVIYKKDNEYTLRRKKGEKPINLTKYLIVK